MAADSPLQIPFAKALGQALSAEQATLELPPTEQLGEHVAGLAQRAGVSVATVMLAAFQVVLHRYTSVERLEISWVRGEAPVTFTTSLAGAPSFLELAQRIRSSLEATPGAPTYSGPLASIRFACECELPVDPHGLLSLVIDKAARALEGRLLYSAQHFDSFHVERLAGHFVSVLQAAVLDPERAIDRLSLLTEAERQQIVVEWNATEGAAAQASALFDAFEQRAAATPDAVAVVSRGRESSYAAINAQANQLARLLRQRGALPGTFVGVCLLRGEAMIVAVLAVLKTGAAYVPLDASYPSDRLAFMLEQTQACAVVTQQELLARLPEASAPYVCLERVAEELAAQSQENLERSSGLDDLAYVIFTSGSTGKPKGVMVRHRPVINVLSWVNESFGVEASDRLLFATSLSFDLSVYDIFGVLGAGASIRIATEEELRDPAALLRILQTEPVTIWDSAPAALQQLVPFMKGPSPSAALRLVMLSGDWIPVAMPDQVRATFPRAKIISLGGATEATIWSNWFPIDKVDPSWPSIPYGKPIRNARYHVLDRHLQPLPVGVPGDLYIGGDVLADGYLGRPDLTRERFIPDPFGRAPAKLYKTGDVARYLPSGDLEFLGRADHQVKVRGFRVETGEIETVLAQQAGVQEVVVKPFQDASRQNYLIAFVVPKPGHRVSPESLTEELRAKLPEYMIPSQVVLRDALLRTPNGKLDRAALKAPQAARRAADDERPRDQMESQIAAVWAEVLGLERVGRSENFFRLGGHSLRAAQVVAKLQDAFAVALRLPMLFAHPTVAALAEAIRTSNPEARSEIALRAGLTRAPASLIQQRFWFLDRNLPDPTVYNVADAIRIRGALQLAALRSAFQALVNRQEVLRTTFVNADGWPEQVVHPARLVDLPLIDLTDHADKEVLCRQYVADDARKRFDLERGPLWRAFVLRLSAEEHVLTWTMHHLIVDESSRALLLSELWQAYALAAEQRPSALPALSTRYLDYSCWQREQITSEDIGYWVRQLKGAPPPIAPPHPKLRPLQRSSQGHTLAFEIPSRIAHGICELSRRAGVTPYITWLAAFQTLLFRHTGQPDVCLGSPVSTRPAAAREVLGCFVNTLVLRTDLSGDPSFVELLARTRETLFGAIEHREVPFEKLVEELKPERIPGGHPLFQTLFIYQGEPLCGTAAGLTWRHDFMDRVGAKFDVTLTIEEKPTGCTGFFEYASDLYDAATIERYVAHFLTLIDAIAAHPDARLGELALLSADEERKVLHDFNASEGPFPSDTCIHQLVQARAALVPDSVAFQCGDETLSFQALNQRANQLAHHLRSLGVGPGTLVGLCVRRSLDMPVAMLGVLKAGGAYVPLDPDFPPERLAFYIRDSAMPLVVAHGQLLENLPVAGLKQVRVDSDAEELARQPADDPPPLSRPEDLAYVLYTSGSTGRPNGVAVEHRSLVNLLWSFAREPGLTGDDTILSITTLSFDIHTVETWLPMVTGARSVIVPRETALDGHRLIELIEKSGTTVMQSTPATWRLLLAAGWTGTPRLKALTGGEALSAELAHQLLGRTAELWNVYGPTETTVWSLVHRVSPSEERVLIGKPILNTRVYVLDPASRRPMPIGCVGEIWIAGAGLARGYLGRDELTQARFIADPYCSAANARMYKTGDLGRFFADGTLECLGRVDHQVKIRGFRIELNEIERVLEEHPGLAQVVVSARTDDEFAAMLHAYYRCQGELRPTPSELRAFAQSRLPDYMIPGTFTLLEAFPQTPNGKVDRKALPAPTADSAARPASREFVVPANDAERALLGIWEEVLGIRPISVTDGFHDLGGHSLLAAALMSRIESRLGHRIPLEALFDKPTIRGLAEIITRKLEFSGGIMVPLRKTGSQPPLFLIAGVGGHVFAFHKFARELGPDIPIYGMKAIGVDGSEPPLSSFEQIARRYVAEILRECPEGPYFIGGYSVGGRIALEVALQLQALGRKVLRLIVVDMFAPTYPRPLPLVRRVLFHTRRFLTLPRAQRRAYLEERVRHLTDRVDPINRRHMQQEHELAAIELVPREILKRVGEALLQANENYRPRERFRGKVVLIQSDVIEEWEGAVERVELQGWGDYATASVEEYTIEAGHLDMFKDEHQPQLAAILRSVMRTATVTSTHPSEAPLPVVAG